MSSTIEQIASQEYKYGFITDIEADQAPPGLNEDIIRLISAKKNEPEWMLEFRLKAFRHWLTMKEPTWANIKYGPIDYQATSYYSAPKQKKKLNSLDEVDPELRATFAKLGISLEEQKRLSGVAV
ncbi:MAG: Fe-S cluster assembly protein SufB, partial [Acidobacteria bacterium]|nr:Fe-S cluster assembly protein SufB [Acidobacteriota bacterium]